MSENECILLTVDGVNGYFPKEFVEEAVKKQMPKKPKERHSRKWGDNYNDGECPNCEATYSDGLSDTPLYCSQCGQALDWSDGERKENG